MARSEVYSFTWAFFFADTACSLRFKAAPANGRLAPEVVFTHRLSLDDGPDAYARFDAREDGLVKVLLTP